MNTLCHAAGLALLMSVTPRLVATPPGPLVFDTLPAAHFEFHGPVGQRVRANLDHWLLTAPQSNPGMLEMFRVRDRYPRPQVVPWAGEFVGKYLISAIQALRMTAHPGLRDQVATVVREFIATQAADGYLGPFPEADRLLKNWDLWGHYHAIEALLRWHEFSADDAALTAARKAADLVCARYLDSGRRVIEAGDPEMNMAILTAMAKLHRLTGEPRYLRMAREVEIDWEQAGDYLRSGLDGREFFASPRPRWESLHDLQGLLELWQITGEAKYAQAFTHHWRSIRRWDRRNTGGFSSGEQATGNPYAATAIETCCTVAWMALTIDYLRLTGDFRAADELELSTLNGGLGAQHPGGRWWTYNTPMDGFREASAHTIVFQARAGTPELNCCSVNAPRVLGMLSEWAMMSDGDGLVVNWLGAGRYSAKLPDGTSVNVESTRDAWRTGETELRIASSSAKPFAVRVRLPAWADSVSASLNDVVQPGSTGGRYLVLTRSWAAGDRLGLKFTVPVRAVPGANEVAGLVSLYRGPLLLAYDQAFNPFDENNLPAVDLMRLASAKVPEATPPGPAARWFDPWIVVDVPTADGRPLRLVDFATAGASGTPYRSWLPAQVAPAAPARTRLPVDGARVPPGDIRFQWRAGRFADGESYRVEFATNEAFAPVVNRVTNTATRLRWNTSQLVTARASDGAATMAPQTNFWRVVAVAASGETLADVPPAWFVIDPAAPLPAYPPEPPQGPRGELVLHSLRDATPPPYGVWLSTNFASTTIEGTEVNGRDQMLRYGVGGWPEEDFSVTLRVRIHELPRGRIGQVFSGWASPMDDPLRLVIDGDRLHARIEAGSVFSTPGTAVETGRWYAVAAVKSGGTLTLFLDGKVVGSCAAPPYLGSRAEECALGGNPRYPGNEFLAARFADFGFHARALSHEETQRLASER